MDTFYWAKSRTQMTIKEAYRAHQKEMNEGRLKKKLVWRKIVSIFKLYSTQTKLYFH